MRCGGNAHSENKGKGGENAYAPSFSLSKYRTAAMPDKIWVKVLSPRKGVRACLEVEYAQK